MNRWDHDPRVRVPDGAEQTLNANPKWVWIDNCPNCDRRHRAELVAEAGLSLPEPEDADLCVRVTAEYEWECRFKRYRTVREEGEPFVDAGAWRKSTEESRESLRRLGAL